MTMKKTTLALIGAAGVMAASLLGAPAASAVPTAAQGNSCDSNGWCTIDGVNYLPYAMRSNDACREQFGKEYSAQQSGPSGIVCAYPNTANPWLTFDWMRACQNQWPGRYPVLHHVDGKDLPNGPNEGAEYIACL
jgi:hypothetical protein